MSRNQNGDPGKTSLDGPALRKRSYKRHLFLVQSSINRAYADRCSLCEEVRDSFDSCKKRCAQANKEYLS